MAGSPVRRAKRAVEDAARALQEGREDDAKRALAELRRTLNETGIEVPPMPKEIGELWLSISEAKPQRKAHMDGTALMSDQARSRLLQAGEIASARLLEVITDDRLFGFTGTLPMDQQMSWLNLALQRGFGGVPAGAQRVALPKEGEASPTQMAIGSTLRLLVRAKQEARDEAELDLSAVDGSAEWESG